MASGSSAGMNGDARPLDARGIADGNEAQKAVSSFIGMYLLVAVTTGLSWLLGYFEMSLLWVIMCLGFLFVIWKAKISRIIQQHLNYEESVLYRKRAFRQNETAEWFNFFLNRWWVFASGSVEELVKKRLDERLWDIRPSFLEHLELTTFSVGEQTPQVRNVRTFECSETSPGSLQPISWFNTSRPPVGLDKMSSYQVVMEADVNMLSEDFKMIFRGRVGSKKVNVAFDMIVEDLNLSGTIQAILHLSMDVPFPHVAKATVSFCEVPNVTFNIRMLKALSMMEVPLLKSWIHKQVMEGLTKAMVDPASVDVHFASSGPILTGMSSKKKEKAQGVLTVHVNGSPAKDGAVEDVRYTVLRIDDRKRQTHEVPGNVEWDDVCSFFIYNLAMERIVVKSKCKRLLTSTTLEENEVNLSSFPFQVKQFADTMIENKDGSKLTLKLQYTPLTPVSLDEEDIQKNSPISEVAGVMYVCIHGASNVLAADKTGASDPYCVLFCDRRRVLTTPYIPRTRNPHWEAWVEFFISDFTQSSLSFYVYDWDGTNTINDDFLGAAHLTMDKTEPVLLKKTLQLGYNKPSEGFTEDKSIGQITISTVFRPVASVARSEKFREVMGVFKANDHLYREDLMSPSSEARNSRGRLSTTAAYVDELQDNIIVELTILQGKDMVAMDRNGYSDPFCVVTMNGKKVFTTAVKKKTLFPKWNETVTLEMSLHTNPTLTIDVFDKDIISKDFMGKLLLTIDNLKELSVKGTSEWHTLERAKTGKLQLKCSVISKDTLKSCSDQVGPDDVFDGTYSSRCNSVPPAVDIDSSFVDSPNQSFSEAPPRGHRPTSGETTQSPRDSGLRRSTSDLGVDKGGRQESPKPSRGGRRDRMPRELQTPPRRKNTHGMRHSDSSNSVNIMQRHPGDNTSIASTVSASDKMFSVSGQVLRMRGNVPSGKEDVYCKVRLEIPGNRLSLFHHSRIIGKSAIINSLGTPPSFNVKFELDRGAGISMDAILTFDIKHSSKEHLATRGFTLRGLLADADDVCRWLSLENGIEIEVSLTQGKPSLNHHRRSGNIFKSFSFRKDKQ